VFGARERWCAALAAIGLVLVPGAARASAPPGNPCAPAPSTAQFSATTHRTGVVDLHFFDARGATVHYFECVGTRAYPLGERSLVMADTPLTSMWAATFWRCGRLTRHFAATTILPDGRFARGTTSVRTRSCAGRFRLEIPSRLARGQRARVRIVDRWGIGGVRTQLCTTSPQAKRRCRSVVLATSTRAVTRHFRPTTRGRWRVELRVPKHRVRGSIAVGVRGLTAKAAPATVLATGDSTMQGIESFLSDELGDERTVISDVRPGFAISLANAWWPIATAQIARLRPSATVVSIGAAEGHPMRAADGAMHACCDEPWVAEYTRRLRKIMLIYGRSARARVLWLTIPAPREAKRVTTFVAVNAAIVRAAEDLANVRVLRMDILFTPNGFRDVMRYRGRDVRVREPDGIHLNVAGTLIAARAVAQALREQR